MIACGADLFVNHGPVGSVFLGGGPECGIPVS